MSRNGNTAEHSTRARAGGLRTYGADDRGILKIPDPDGTKAFIVNIERREEVAGGDCEMRISDVVELKEINAGESSRMEGAAVSIFLENQFANSTASLNKPLVARRNEYDRSDLR